MEEVKKEKWQYRGMLSEGWNVDNRAMNNPKYKSFADYEKHIHSLNEKHGYKCECKQF